ncbi:MAG TPA: hypothetical protein VKD72_12495 [Gemmataceae bacterium]|nr:hypothetical protein [Gemmataceae bacterium]
MAKPYRVAEAKIAAKVEASPGVTETLASGDVFLGQDVSLQLKYGDNQNAGLTGVLSKEAGASGMQTGELSFKVAMKGQGAAGTAPEWRDAIMSCGFSETISGGVSVAYAPAAPESYYTYGVEFPGLGGAGEDLIFRLTGCQGSFKLTWKGGEFMFMECTVQGVIVTAPADGSQLGSPTWDTTAPNAFLAPAMTFHGVSGLAFETFELDMGQEIAIRPNANGATGALTAQITGRRPRGSVDFEHEKLATFNPNTRITGNTTGAISMTAIGAAGNKVAVSCPKVRFFSEDLADRAGALVAKLGFEALRSANAGNDEVSIVLT